MDSMSYNPQRISVGTMDYNPDELDSEPMSTRPMNPPFQFPARQSFDAKSEYVPPPLPTFSFNPGNLHVATPSTSTLTAPRHGGHRRRPSELIGGEGPPSPRMSSTSLGAVDTEGANLTKLGAEIANPTQPGAGAAPRGPVPGRRGHAHRRSQAMSSMDLTALTMGAPPTLMLGSAPTSPANNLHEFQSHASRPMSRSAVDLVPSHSPPASPVKKPEYIRSDVAAPEEQRPRPVSMISVDTSSSLSTVRPNHSRVNSAAPSNRAEDSLGDRIKVRPKTADPTLLVPKPPNSPEQLSGVPVARRSSLGLGLRHSSEAEGVSEGEFTKEKKSTKKDKKKKKKKKGGEEKTGYDDGRKRIGSERTLDLTQGPPAEKWETSSSFNSRSDADDDYSKKPDISHNRKQKKVRGWAGAIFPLKNKRTHAKRPLSRRSPTPPPILTRTNSDMGSIEVNFDEDNTVIIRTPTNTATPNQPSQNATESNDTTFESAWKPRSFYEQGIENDILSPVIDLDAALGPFNTPEMSSGQVAGSAFSQATKRMYSGGRRGEFIGPEMRYHRRAESAPEMPPVDRSVFAGFTRLGSDMTMANADVFYEEEEDAFLAENETQAADDHHSVSDNVETKTSNVIEEESEGELPPSSSETLRAVTQEHSPTTGVTPSDGGLGIQVTEDAVSVDDGPGDSVFDEDEERDNEDNNKSNTLSRPGVHNKKSVEIVEADHWTPPRAAPHTHSPDTSPHILAIEKRPCSSPVDLNPGLSQLTLPSRQASSSAFPSPDPSNISFEGMRSATASSMTDHTTFNHSLHDQRHSSFEDVPSLSSSASTRTTNHRGRFSSNFHPPRSSRERLESPCNPLPPRSSQSNSAKRASLVSLSRLVGGSYGEKSKLSHEEKPPAEETEKTRRRSHRVSRLMFWKSKDKQSNA